MKYPVPHEGVVDRAIGIRSFYKAHVLRALLVPLAVCLPGVGFSQELTDSSLEVPEVQPIVEYTQTHGMLGPDAAVSIKLYSDGRVEIDLPNLNPNHEAKNTFIETEELSSIATGILAASLLDEEDEETAPGLLTWTSDNTYTELSLNVINYRTSNGVVVDLPQPINIAEKNLGLRAGGSTGRLAAGRTTSLATLEQQLLGLIEKAAAEAK